MGVPDKDGGAVDGAARHRTHTFAWRGRGAHGRNEVDAVHHSQRIPPSGSHCRRGPRSLCEHGYLPLLVLQSDKVSVIPFGTSAHILFQDVYARAAGSLSRDLFPLSAKCVRGRRRVHSLSVRPP